MRTRKLIGLGLAVIVTYAIFIQSAFAEGQCDEACAEGGVRWIQTGTMFAQ